MESMSIIYKEISKGLTNINTEGLVGSSGIFNLTTEPSSWRHDITAHTEQIDISNVISLSMKCYCSLSDVDDLTSIGKLPFPVLRWVPATWNPVRCTNKLLRCFSPNVSDKDATVWFYGNSIMG